MAIKDFSELAGEIIQNVGGAENIKDLRYCSTRLRFRLKKDRKANAEELKALAGVSMAVRNNGQYQVLVSNVKDVYDAIVSQGIKGVGQVDSQNAWAN